MKPAGTSVSGRRSTTRALVFFGLGLGLTIIGLSLPVTRELLRTVSEAGPIAALLGGFLYSGSLTSSLATVVFAQMPASSNVVLTALVGGLGAAGYDALIDILIRRTMNGRPFIARVTDRLRARRRLRWTTYVTGALIIASPLPDELGTALLDVGGIRRRAFLPLSFGLNTLGILVILGLT